MARRTPRRQPQQARAQATVDVILEAAAQVLVAEGPAGATTNRIAERAGVSVGSVYQYFANKRALYDALGARFIGKLRQTIAASAPALLMLPEHELLPRALDALLAPIVADPVLNGMLHLTALPPRDFEAINLFERELEAQVALLIAAHPGLRARCPDASLSARIIVRGAAGAIARTLAIEPELVATPAFRTELARLVGGFLGLAVPETERAG